MLKSPREYGADIAVGEGQPLGMPLSWGGPYLGFMAAPPSMMRKLPGRIVGETTDRRGERAFVLTLQAREQHIRREKASLQHLLQPGAVRADRLGLPGRHGSRRSSAGGRSVLRQGPLPGFRAVPRSPGVSLAYPGPFFHEFVTDPARHPRRCFSALERAGILGGLPVEGGVLWCATEKQTKADLDEAVAIVKEVLDK